MTLVPFWLSSSQNIGGGGGGICLLMRGWGTCRAPVLCGLLCWLWLPCKSASRRLPALYRDDCAGRACPENRGLLGEGLWDVLQGNFFISTLKVCQWALHAKGKWWAEVLRGEWGYLAEWIPTRGTVNTRSEEGIDSFIWIIISLIGTWPNEWMEESTLVWPKHQAGEGEQQAVIELGSGPGRPECQG